MKKVLNLKQFITAWQFLTIIPLSIRIEVTAESLGKSMAVFPLVGLVLGLLIAALDYGFSYIFPPSVVSAVVLTSYIAIYGGFHLDGLADTVDGIAGGRDREHILKIMKDSSIGAIGVVVMILLLLTKYQTINALPGNVRLGSLILMPVTGRWIEVLMAYGSRYAREIDGLGRPFAEYTGKRELLVASISAFIIAWLTLSWNGVVAIAVTALLGLMMKRFFDKKTGGITGDILGAAGEVSELAMLLIMAAGK